MELLFENVTVPEDADNVTVTVRATGISDIPPNTAVDISVYLFTVDGSAEGKFYI